jgi:L-fuconolactonase
MIDTHVHFYDPERPQGVPWPSPDQKRLYRRVLPEHYRALADPEGVTGIIVVEASPWVQDNDWILRLAEVEPWIVGFVGNLDPFSGDFAGHLDRLSGHPLFRGIRLGRSHLLRAREGGLDDAMARLSARGLTLDLLVGSEDLPEVARLAADHPDLKIVLNHVALVPIDGRAPDPSWKAGIRTVAAHRGVYCKVSGLVEAAVGQPVPLDPVYYAPTVEALLEILGEDRLLFGTNWPVCERAAGFADVVRIARECLAQKGETVLAKVFRDNSRAAYGWRPR